MYEKHRLEVSTCQDMTKEDIPIDKCGFVTIYNEGVLCDYGKVDPSSKSSTLERLWRRLANSSDFSLILEEPKTF